MASKWYENVSTVKRRGILTLYASRKVDKTLAAATWSVIDVSSISCFVVAIRSGVGIIPEKFAFHFL